jgi:hypothetical protein
MAYFFSFLIDRKAATTAMTPRVKRKSFLVRMANGPFMTEANYTQTTLGRQQSARTGD